MTKQIGLSAANYLLMAKGHLVKAREKLAKHQSRGRIMTDKEMAYEATWSAIDATRHALNLLKEKEEPCNAP